VNITSIHRYEFGGGARFPSGPCSALPLCCIAAGILLDTAHLAVIRWERPELEAF
jgi:hypothetical protein